MFKLFQVFDGSNLNDKDTFDFDGPVLVRVDTIKRIEHVTDDFSVIIYDGGQMLVRGNFIKIGREIERSKEEI